MNPLENQLRSWTPRPPSAGLRARIFLDSGAGTAESPFVATWRQLAPATAIVLFALVTLNNHSLNSQYWSGASANRGLATAAVSNLTAASYVTSLDACDRNSYPAATFASTKPEPAPSSNGSFWQFNTNGLIH